MSNHRLPKCLEVHSRQNVCSRSLLLIFIKSARAVGHFGIYRFVYLVELVLILNSAIRKWN